MKAVRQAEQNPAGQLRQLESLLEQSLALPSSNSPNCFGSCLVEFGLEKGTNSFNLLSHIEVPYTFSEEAILNVELDKLAQMGQVSN